MNDRFLIVVGGHVDAPRPHDLMVRRALQTPDHYAVRRVGDNSEYFGDLTTPEDALQIALLLADYEGSGATVWFQSSDLAGRPLGPAEAVNDWRPR